MNDQFWQITRYLLIALGSFFAGKGKIAPEDVAPFVDETIRIASGLVALGTAAWGLYVKFRTRSVPAHVAAHVQTVSSATGALN